VIEWNNLPIPLENIERIEVVRGPAAAAYGSNALQAVINIQTGSAAEYAGSFGPIAGGGDGIADGFLRYGGRVGSMDYALSLASVGDSGYPGVYDDRRNTSLSFLGEMPFEAGGELQLQAGFARGDYGIQDPEPALPANPRDFPVTDTSRACAGGGPVRRTTSGSSPCRTTPSITATGVFQRPDSCPASRCASITTFGRSATRPTSNTSGVSPTAGAPR
jgi:outer membrane receptor protein involved in Fe transport